MAEFIEIMEGLRIPESEVSFTFSRSGGPGGQNVNKVSTRVELRFDIGSSRSLDAAQKSILLNVLGSRAAAGEERKAPGGCRSTSPLRVSWPSASHRSWASVRGA